MRRLVHHPGSGLGHPNAYSPHHLVPVALLPLVIGLSVGALLVWFPRTWRVVRFAVTFVHELGHAVAVGMVGGVPMALVLEPNSAGRTSHLLPAGTMRRVTTAMAGYPAPAIAALFLTQLLVLGQPVLSVVIASGLGCAVLVLWARNLLAACASLLLIGIGLLALSPPWVLYSATGVFISILAVGGIRSSFRIATLPSIDSVANDALSINEATGLPSRWVGVGFCCLTSVFAAAPSVVLIAATR